MGRLTGKVAIVTGAGGGIGSAICRQFAAEGAGLVGVDIDAGALDKMAASVRADGGRTATLVADVAEEAVAEAAVRTARAEFGRLDVLVSNAVCDLPHGPVTGVSLADWRRTMALDHAGQNIRVNSLSPGPVETPRYVRNFATLEAARASHHTLTGRLGAPDEIAAGAVFLASDESAFMTGADLLIDGGYTAV